MTPSSLRSRAVWVPVLAVAGGIVLVAAVVNTVGRPRSVESAAASASDVVASAESSPSAIESGSSLPGPTASAGATPGLAAGWTISMFPATDPYDRVERIVQLGDEFFVVGEHSSQGGIWRSTDGKSWRLAASTPTAGTINGVEIHGIARTAVGFVAVGANYAIDGASPVVWYSPDGDTWTDVTPNPNECAVLFGVAAAGPQFVAVGVVCKDDPQRGPGSDGVSFASTDGRQWQRSPASDVLVDRALEDVIWTGSEYVASGLHSTDGLSWEESGVDGQPTSRRLISANDWLVGVGSITNPAGQPLAALWVSTDGMTWATRIVGEVGSEARAIAISDRGWLVTGNWIESEGALGAAVEWRSEDGITWGGARRIMAQGLGYVDDLLAMGSTVIGIGGVQAGETTDPWPPVIMRLEY